MLQALAERAEEFVEQMAGGRRGAVAVVTPLPIMPAGWFVGGGGRECPHPPDVGEPVVLWHPLHLSEVDGRLHVGFGRALMRRVLLAFVIPALFMDGDGRGLHDKATLTAVVRR